MKPGKRNLEFYQGDVGEVFFRVRDAVWNSSTLSYDPGDYKVLTGYTVKAQIRASRSITATLIAEFTASLGDQTAYPGSVLLTLTSVQTAAMVAPPTVVKNTYQWDVQLTDTAGKPRTYLSGAVSVLPQVTE